MRLDYLVVTTLLFLQLSCSGAGDANDGDHVWKEQTDTIDRAREVENMMLKSAEDKARKLEQATN